MRPPCRPRADRFQRERTSQPLVEAHMMVLPGRKMRLRQFAGAPAALSLRLSGPAPVYVDIV